jgi:hypothetical protein
MKQKARANQMEPLQQKRGRLARAPVRREILQTFNEVGIWLMFH